MPVLALLTFPEGLALQLLDRKDRPEEVAGILRWLPLAISLKALQEHCLHSHPSTNVYLTVRLDVLPVMPSLEISPESLQPETSSTGWQARSSLAPHTCIPS